MSDQYYYFHAGKGGVGKSTTSTLSAMHLARTGRKVLLVSLDPAHNQADIFDAPFTGKPVDAAPNLRVAQADVDKWVTEYIKGVENQLQANYTYQTAFNLEKHLKVIKHSPGIEEYGLLLAFQHYRKNFPNADVIVFDMPPTALTTKFFNLPALSLIWLEQLLILRKEILEKKELITKIQLGKMEIQCDKVSARLEQQRKFFTELREIFESPPARRSINLVVNPDKLSFAEAESYRDQLRGDEYPPDPHHHEQRSPTPVPSTRTRPSCATEACAQLPLSPVPLIGPDALNAYLDTYGDRFAFLEQPLG